MLISVWLRKEARLFARDILSLAGIRQRGLFDLDHVEKQLGEHEAGFRITSLSCADCLA